MLLILVGLSSVSVSNPLSIAGCDSRVVRLPVTVVSAEPRRKTTGSVSLMLRLFFGDIFTPCGQLTATTASGGGG